jgi:hypothetical protein
MADTPNHQSHVTSNVYGTQTSRRTFMADTPAYHSPDNVQERVKKIC